MMLDLIVECIVFEEHRETILIRSCRLEMDEADFPASCAKEAVALRVTL
jgi:hypothetical protein